jgi:preprotein translocase subunit SecE
MNLFKKIGNFFNEVKTQMKKVDWPSKEKTIKDTIAVVSISFAVAIFLGGLDFLFGKLLNIFIS